MTDTNHANGTTPNGIVTNGVHAPDQLDVLVIGAGFSGCYLLHKLRALGYKTRVVESGGGIGGVWHWSTYPGARVDSPYPYYALSIPEVWKDWEYTEMYPGWQELRRYFEHVGKTLDLNKDMVFNTTVTAANFDENTNTWTVSCSDGKQYKTRFLVAGVGFAAKKHIPDWEGLDRCKATIVHSSYWPDDLDIKGKKLAVVGNGATGVQIIQECANEVEELTAFVRTPNLCLPMQQKRLSSEGQQKDKATLQQVYSHRLTTFGGLSFSPLPRPHTADTPEQREKLYEDLWQQGGFALMAGNYYDTLLDPVANDLAYQFWLRKTRARITDPEKADILAPIKAPHILGGKRPSLEQNYYEKINLPNVHIVNAKKTPIVKFTQQGLMTSDGKDHKFDVIVLATGYDAVSGSLSNIDITGLGGERLVDKWKSGVYTHLGLAAANFPNFFFTYGPQSPTAFSNGPSCVEPQCDWIIQVLSQMKTKGQTRINATRDAELEWKKTINSISEATLVHHVDSWYMGANIPGKPREALNYLGGLPNYIKAMQDSMEDGLRGFEVS